MSKAIDKLLKFLKCYWWNTSKIIVPLFHFDSSPSLIALSSKDPVLTAFQMSNTLKRLGYMESQFKEEYKTLRKKVQEFAVGK